MLDRLPLQFGGGSNAAREFSDVTPAGNPWSYSAIQEMARYGILQGYPDGLYHPAERITRAQMAVIMDRASSFFEGGILLASLP